MGVPVMFIYRCELESSFTLLLLYLYNTRSLSLSCLLSTILALSCPSLLVFYFPSSFGLYTRNLGSLIILTP